MGMGVFAGPFSGNANSLSSESTGAMTQDGSKWATAARTSNKSKTVELTKTFINKPPFLLETRP
jgi:hypothetical protein